MGNISQKDIEAIEAQLENATTPLEKKISKEYYYLKNALRSPEKQEKENNSNNCIVNNIKVKKRMERFAKWFKMIFPNTAEIILRTKTKQTTFSNKLADNEPKHNLKHGKTESFPFFRGTLNQLDLDYSINNFQPNSLEIPLRKYYENNKLHFLERVRKGPPESLRWISWLIIMNIPENRNDVLIKKYFLDEIEEKSDCQIKKDLNRTLIELDTKKTDANLEEKEQSLYRVLRSLANIDKVLGYCQGVNFIAGFLLTISDYNEIETFYMLISLFSNTFEANFNLRGFYMENFPLFECYMFIFDNMIKKEMPELREHILELEIPNEAWIGKWIQTLYTISLPVEINERLWDCLISVGLYFIISFSVSLLQCIEKELMEIKDASDFTEFFKDFFGTPNTNGVNNIKKSVNPKSISIDTIIANSMKIHKSYSSKNFFINLKEEFSEKVKHFEQCSIAYDINITTSCLYLYHQNSNCYSNSNMTNFLSSYLDEENAESCCDEHEGGLNTFKENSKGILNYVFNIKKGDKKK